MKDFFLKTIANTKIDREIDYFGGVDAVYIDGKIHNVGSRALALCVLTNEDGWRNIINFQEGLSFGGLIDGSVSINKNEILYVVGKNGGVYYLENKKWITEYEPDNSLAKKWLFEGDYDTENDRLVISGGYSGKTAKNNITFIYKNGKWLKISNKILKQENKDNLVLRKSKPYEYINSIDVVQCYDYNLKKIILLGGKYSYILDEKKWNHFETNGLENIALNYRKIFHVKHLKKTFILSEDGVLYEYSKEYIAPYAKINLSELGFTFYNSSCNYSDEKKCLYLFGKEGNGFTVKIS